jgi:hypothetical protein
MSGTQSRPLSGISDADLVRFASTSGAGACSPMNALGELYRRYAPALYAHCVSLYGNEFFTPEEVKCFVGQVFLRFQRYADQFDPAVAQSPSDLPKLIRFWLAKQAKWAIGEHRVEAENKEAACADIDVLELPTAAVQHRRSKRFLDRLRRLKHVLRSWPAKDRDIIMTSFRHRDPETGLFHLPETEQERLRITWGFTSNNSLLKYRNRRVEDLRATMLADVA